MFKKLNKFIKKIEMSGSNPTSSSTCGSSLEIPLAGNCFITQKVKGAHEVITDNGLANWVDPYTICSVYFRLSAPASFSLSLRLYVAPAGSSSRIRVFLENPDLQEIQLDISGDEYHDVNVGIFHQEREGYVKVNLQGLENTGGYFGDVSHLLVQVLESLGGNEASIVHVCPAFDFHFGRRGPSVHLSYQIPPSVTNPDFFYNEITVPQAQDVKGSYFCAAGFTGGYFGIQVNSSVERRVLFSVWSTFETDNPEEIPEECRVELLRRGPDVTVGEFGNEGSGGQSYLVFPWITECKYRFLLSGLPIDADNTRFTAWFSSENDPDWRLIASFRQPKTSTHLAGLYSFSENFKPKKGHLERRVLFGNQWIRDGNSGQWTEICNVTFTGDETSKGSRSDFGGGVCDHDPGQFFLRNCGFFDDFVHTNQSFSRAPCGTGPPEIDFQRLP